MTRRFRAPAADRAVLADPPFDSIPELVERTRKLLARADVRVGGLPLTEFRKQARAEILGDTSDVPLLVAGHQPELTHPGVWVKNFALNGLAKKLGGVPLHLIVDNDTMKSAAVAFPVWDEWTPESVRLETAAFDEFDADQPWETRAVREPGKWVEFSKRVAEAARKWGYEPLLTSGTGNAATGWGNKADHPVTAFPVPEERTGTWGHFFTAARRQFELAWGCDNRELPVSLLSQTQSFRRLARHIADDAERFRHAYNSAVRAYRRTHGLRSQSHPVPDLADGELPFWVIEGTRRRAAMTVDCADIELPLRPRALTLTLFARLGLGDFFVHGIGGGKYDEVTDAIIRDYFDVEPPAYQVLSATLHLPLPSFPATTDDVHRLHRRRRDLDWNPEPFIDPREAIQLKRRKWELLERQPNDRAERRGWFRELHEVKRAMRPYAADRVADADRELARAKVEVAANAILRRRDYSWVLYPEAVLRPFLVQFL